MKIRNLEYNTRRTVLKLTGVGPAIGASLAVSGTVNAKSDRGWTDRRIKVGHKRGKLTGFCGSSQSVEQFLRNENFEEVVVSTWAAEQGERGRLPVGVTFEFVEEAEGGDDNRRRPQDGEP